MIASSLLRIGPLAVALLAGTAAHADTRFGGQGKLLLTGGVSSIDGAAGGGLGPWAVIGSPATEGEVGATAHLTRARTQDYALTTWGVALGWNDRVEVSLARQAFDAGVVVSQAVLRQTIVGAKLRVAGDAILESDSWMPQLAIGVESRRLDPGIAVGNVLDAVGAKRHGLDVYASATKLFLSTGVLVNGTLRATQANQNGLLGYGATDHKNVHAEPELSVAKLLRRNLAIGAEYRSKPDNLAFAGAAFREDDWKDVFIAWAPAKQLSLTLAWVDLGNIVGHKGQRGAYLSLQAAL
jgi:hypothetical protein